MPKKIREIIKEYRKAGFTIDTGSGKGSHRKIRHPRYADLWTILAHKEGDDAKPYQERDMRNLIETAKTRQKEEESGG